MQACETAQPSSQACGRAAPNVARRLVHASRGPQRLVRGDVGSVGRLDFESGGHQAAASKQQHGHDSSEFNGFNALPGNKNMLAILHAYHPAEVDANVEFCFPYYSPSLYSVRQAAPRLIGLL